MFKNMKIGSKILIAFTLVVIVAVGLVGFFAFTTGSNALELESFNKLTAVREMKASQIEDYFILIENQVVTLSEDRMIIEAMRDFDDGLHVLETDLSTTDIEMNGIDARLKDYYEGEFLPRLIPNLLQDVSVDDFWPDDRKTRIIQDLYISSNPFEVGSKQLLDNAGDGSSYSQLHNIYHPIIRDYLEKFGYYDIFLVDVDTGGHIAYSVFKEVDFGTSLLTGPYANTNFAVAYKAAKEAADKDFVKVVDFEPYAPSYNAPAAFIASPIFDGDEKIGVLVFQMPIDRINDIMTSNQNWSAVGLGESGETYIVGDDFTLRNQSRFLIEDSENYFNLIEEIGTPLATIASIRNFNSTIGLQEVKTEGTEVALSGETGMAIFPDYRGVPVLSSYKPLNIRDVNWVIMSEIDEEEAFAAIRSLGIRTLIGTLILIAVIVVLAVLFSRTITRPLDDLTQTADELAKGNLDVEVSCTEQGDEIGTLACSFDSMRVSMKGLIGDLEDINQNLENLVEERTKELELATERVRTIIEIAPDAVISINSQQIITLFNPKAEEIFGYSVDEVLGQPLTMLMQEKSRGLHSSEVSKFSDESVSARSMDARREILGQKKDGTIFPAEAGISKMEISGEQYFTTFFRDITKRKLAEQTIRDREERLSAFTTALPDLAFIIDEDGRYEAILSSQDEQLVLPEDEMLGRVFHDLLPQELADQLLAIVKNALDTGETQVVEYVLEVPAGQLWFEGRCAPITESLGDKRLAVLLVRDITERKQLEAQLELANERMSEELNFARDIQMGLLPLIFPAFPTRSEFSIFASLIPAREVGGDFYDFYFLDEHHLCFVVGDVSGKGAPGALLMAVSKTLIKSRAMDDFSPSSILTHVNTELSQNNDAAMFVTVFLGIMDIRTGKIEYTNAGHNPPYIRRKGGSVEKLDAFHGPVIGAMPNLHYKEDTTVLEQNDIVVVFSDGITEAMNIDDELYSDARLEQFLATDNLNTSQKLVDQVVRDVKLHEGDAEQADDITIMALKFTGQTDVEETGRLDLKIKNQITELAVVEEKFEAFCQEFKIPDMARQQVSMVLDEMLNNVVSYAYRDENEHIIDVEFVLSGPRLVISVRDDGVPFNPFALDPPNIAMTLDEREIGGLGIYMVRGVMDEYMYNRHIGRNVVTLVKLIKKN